MLNWTVVGVGDIAIRRVIPAIQAEPRSRLYGIITRDPAKGRRYAEHVSADLEEALRDPAVDVVYVATPVFLHGPQTLAALAAGKHVLCEKPTAMNFAQAREMAAMARERGRLFGVAYYRRTYPKILRAQKLLAAGAVGRPVMAYATAHDWFNDEDGTRSWFLDPAKAGGGPLFDTACHRIDVMNLLFGKPVAVTAQRSNVVHQGAVEDSATVLTEYENGVRSIVDVRRHSRVSRDEFHIIGTEGEIDLTPLNGGALRSPKGNEELPPHSNLHYPLIENFVDAAEKGVPLASPGEAALATDWVIEEAVRASSKMVAQDCTAT